MAGVFLVSGRQVDSGVELDMYVFIYVFKLSPNGIYFLPIEAVKLSYKKAGTRVIVALGFPTTVDSQTLTSHSCLRIHNCWCEAK
jgi:hypothetical protein